MNLSYREATVADVPGIVALLTETWPDNARLRNVAAYEIADAFSSANYRPSYLVAASGNTIVAAGGWDASSLNWGMYNLFWGTVRDGFRRKGLGRWLVGARLEAIDRAARAVGERKWSVWVSTHLPLVYEAYGFRRASESFQYGATLEPDSCLMVRDFMR